MKKQTKRTVKAGVKIGALAGGLLFLVGGLVPAIYLSSFATIAALSAVAGGPVEPTLLVRAVLVTGSVLGVCAAGAVSITAGAAAGSALGYVAEAITPKPAADAQESEN